MNHNVHADYVKTFLDKMRSMASEEKKEAEAFLVSCNTGITAVRKKWVITY